MDAPNVAAIPVTPQESAPSPPSCGTCQHWKLRHYEGFGVCGVILMGGRSSPDAEIVGGGQGVSEPVELETARRFSCALWKAKP